MRGSPRSTAPINSQRPMTGSGEATLEVVDPLSVNWRHTARALKSKPRGHPTWRYREVLVVCRDSYVNPRRRSLTARDGRQRRHLAHHAAPGRHRSRHRAARRKQPTAQMENCARLAPVRSGHDPFSAASPASRTACRADPPSGRPRQDCHRRCSPRFPGYRPLQVAAALPATFKQLSVWELVGCALCSLQLRHPRFRSAR